MDKDNGVKEHSLDFFHLVSGHCLILNSAFRIICFGQVFLTSAQTLTLPPVLTLAPV